MEALGLDQEWMTTEHSMGVRESCNPMVEQVAIFSFVFPFSLDPVEPIVSSG